MVKDAVIPAIQIYPTKNDNQIFIILIILRDNGILLCIILYHIGPWFKIRYYLVIFDRILFVVYVFDGVIRFGDIIVQIIAIFHLFWILSIFGLFLFRGQQIRLVFEVKQVVFCEMFVFFDGFRLLFDD